MLEISLLIGRNEATFQAQAALFLPLMVLVSCAYLVLAIRFWFRTPVVGIALSGVCFVASWILLVIGG